MKTKRIERFGRNHTTARCVSWSKMTSKINKLKQHIGHIRPVFSQASWVDGGRRRRGDASREGIGGFWQESGRHDWELRRFGKEVGGSRSAHADTIRLPSPGHPFDDRLQLQFPSSPMAAVDSFGLQGARFGCNLQCTQARVQPF